MDWSTVILSDSGSSQAPGPGGSERLTDRYEILGSAGAGGMGVVYRARHKSLGRPVAIKLMKPGMPVDRFLREAKLLAQLASPHVVAVHDYDVLPDGSPFLVIEWVDGGDLRRLMDDRGGKITESEALPLMSQVCEGMIAAEAAGIIHRDLKPANILLDSAGRARVADFGLARAGLSIDPALPTEGALGTPYYMAPEQAEDPKRVDSRADIYSFGATFYHALTGAPPFDGETPFTVYFKHKTEPLVPPRAVNDLLSAPVNDLLERCLAKSPGSRFASFGEVRDHLKPATSEGSNAWGDTTDVELGRYLRDFEEHRRDGLFWSPAGQTYRFPQGRILTIRRGDLTEESVHALVSSNDCYLTMDWGVSASLLRKGGVGIREEAQKFTPVRAGRVVVTTAGKLRARFVFHGVTLGLSGGRLGAVSRDLIAEIIASCFYHADTLDVRSIAFPLLGTGVGGFSREVCLDTMFRALATTLLRGVTCVREARIILYDEPTSPI